MKNPIMCKSTFFKLVIAKLRSHISTLFLPLSCAQSSSLLRKLCGKAPRELVEMLSPLQQQQGSGHGSKHPTCPKLAAK